MAQGRCSAMLAVLAVLLVSAAVVVNGTTYTVGDGTGWTEPSSPTFYAEWAANHTFVAGDSLLFVYAKARHNVLVVTSADYASCTLTSTNKLATGNDTVTLVAGANSFVCGVPGHCTVGQKLTVNATAAPSSNPITPPTTTTPAPSTPNAATAGTTATVFHVVVAAMLSVVASLAL